LVATAATEATLSIAAAVALAAAAEASGVVLGLGGSNTSLASSEVPKAAVLDVV
jgi:hypothetical protein